MDDGTGLTEPSQGRGEVARWLLRGLGFALGVMLVLGALVGMVLAWRVMVVVFVSILIGSATEPLIARGRGRFPMPRGLAILGLYTTLAVAVAAVALVFLPGAMAEADDIITRLPAALDSIEAWAGSVQPDLVGTSIASLADAARAALIDARPLRPDEVVGVGLTVAEAAVTIVTAGALIYFWITERARLQRYATAFLPLDRRAGARDAWNDIELRLGGWVRGQLVLMGSVALATGTAYSVLGLPSAILLGLVAGVTELIPLIGPALGAIPALLVAATLRPDLLVPVLIVYLIIQFVEGNVLVPIVMRGSVGISPFVVLVSVLVGGAIGGLVGALLAIPLAAIAVVILERAQAREVPVTLDPNAPAVADPSDGEPATDDLTTAEPEARPATASG